jgi:GlpG protein
MPDDSPSGAPNPRDAKPRGGGGGSFGGFGMMAMAPATIGLIAVCVVIFVFSGFGNAPRDGWTHWLYISDNPFVPWLAVSRRAAAYGIQPAFLPEVFHGQIWRLVTPILMHGSILHILFNMFWLRDLGTLLETRHGSYRFLLLVLATGIGSNLLQYAIAGPNFLGMSGVVYGLLGYIWVQGKLNPAFGFELNSQTVMIMAAWLVLGFTGMLGPIANWAHLGGLIMGAGIGAIAAWQSGAGEMLERRREFRAALTPSTDAMHRCRICRRTDLTNPELEFRVSGNDGEEYCREHLPGK